MKLFIIEPRGNGGMLHYAFQLCNALSQYEPDICLVTSKKFELEGYFHNFKIIKFFNLWDKSDRLSDVMQKHKNLSSFVYIFRKIRRVFRGIRYIFEWIRLVRYILEAKPDIVQFGEIEFPFEAIFLQYLKLKGLILTQICHEFEARELNNKLLVNINQRLLKNVFLSFSIIFFLSKSNLERFEEIYTEISTNKLHVITMGNGELFPLLGENHNICNELRSFYQISEEDKVILFFGNITPSKGVSDLLTAFKKVLSENKMARLIIAGRPLKFININSLFNQATRLGIESKTFFDMRYIPVEEVESLIMLATVVVFPYLSSTQSASIQAAYAIGKPVVATRVGGLPDVVFEGKSGFLVEPNSPAELSNAILKIINNPKLAAKMGIFAKDLSKTRFSWDPVAKGMLDIYQKFLEGKSA